MQFNALNMINGIGLWLIVAGCLSVVESTFVCPVQQADDSDDSFVMLYPSPTNCSEFYECVRGEALRYACPVDLHFNTRRKTMALEQITFSAKQFV
uniref:Chitin-binding type-2 domain-containing protein n=1 Tax=Glossina pallidipes TaxID=7398 RepID=A0A1A9ZWE8_GLOPL